MVDGEAILSVRMLQPMAAKSRPQSCRQTGRAAPERDNFAAHSRPHKRSYLIAYKQPIIWVAGPWIDRSNNDNLQLDDRRNLSCVRRCTARRFRTIFCKGRAAVRKRSVSP